MDAEKKQLITRVAYRYYICNYTQIQIANELGIYRTTVSRILKKAQQEKIVTVHINNLEDYSFDLEEKLKKKFQLLNVIIVSNYSKESMTQKNIKLAAAAAQYLKQIIRKDQLVGFSWGSILAHMVGQLNNSIQTSATFVPLVGGPSISNQQYHVNGIIYDMAHHFHGKSLYINNRAVQNSVYNKKTLLQAKYSNILQCWKHLDIAFVEIGGPLNTKNSHWRDLLSADDYQNLKERKAIGDCCCTFFDHNGKIISGDLLDRTIAIPLKQLSKIHTVVVAHSLTKAMAITIFLKMNIASTLITDRQTAERILKIY